MKVQPLSPSHMKTTVTAAKQNNWQQAQKVDVLLLGFIHFSGWPASIQLDHSFSLLQFSPLERIIGSEQPEFGTKTDGFICNKKK